MMSTVPASMSTGIDSRTIRRRIGSLARRLSTSETMPATVHSAATTGVTHATPTRKVARNNAGSVIMSPAAVTIGPATLSRS